MKHPALEKKFNDWEYERRFNRMFLVQLLALLPVFPFAWVVWLEYGSIPLPAVGCAALTSAAIVLVLNRISRRDTIAAMRREGLIDEDYSPPRF